MRLRSRHHHTAPFLLLLLPSLTLALSTSEPPSADTQTTSALSDTIEDDYSTTTPADISGSGTGGGSGIGVAAKGTKDAPVDGLDGKPHAGPFVESTKKKLPQEVEDITATHATVKGHHEDGSPLSSSSPSSRTKTTKISDLPEDDGVMSDIGDRKAITGPTGTEGGVSQKDKDRKQNGEKKTPEKPKSVRPRPNGDDDEVVTATKAQTEVSDQRKKGAAGLEKPADLPDKTHDIPLPKPAGLKDSNHLATHHSSKLSSSAATEDGILHPFHSFFLSLTMIIFSEIGDKTFLVAALMAMRHDRMVVFSAAFSALGVMTVLSALLGHAVPTLLPKWLTGFGAAVLFFVFGAKLLKEGLEMDAEEGVGEEMAEVEMELEEKELEMRRFKRRSSVNPYSLESGLGSRGRSSSTLPAPARSPSTSPSPPPSPSSLNSLASLLAGLNNLCSLLLSPAWVQTFVMTFLGEWGDRSQIATIAMAAGQDYWWITGGAVVGHAMCTAVAVIGGRAIAGKVSMKKVTLGGAVAFLIFGVIYLAESIYSRS